MIANPDKRVFLEKKWFNHPLENIAGYEMFYCVNEGDNYCEIGLFLDDKHVVTFWREDDVVEKLEELLVKVKALRRRTRKEKRRIK